MSVENAKGAGLIQDGDLVVVTAGVPVGVSGTTNMIKVHMVGDSLLAGVGIGSRNAKEAKFASAAAQPRLPRSSSPVRSWSCLSPPTMSCRSSAGPPVSSPRKPVPTAIPLSLA